ncbi:MAG: hypothetical protein AB1898_32435 [Acidobacteriota bacterium]
MMEHVVEIIKAIAWPVTLVWLAYFLRGDLQAMLKRISTLKYGEAEATFEKDVSKAHAIAKALGKKDGSARSRKSPETAAELGTKDQLYRIAQISPRASIVEAWRYFEETIKRVAQRYGIEAKGLASEKLVIQRLMDDYETDEDFAKLYLLLRELRNRAAHTQDFALNRESAEEYVDTILELNEELERLIQNPV